MIFRTQTLLLTFAVLGFAVMSSLGQVSKDSAEESMEGSVLKPRFQKDERLIFQLLRDPEGAPQPLREELLELREAQRAIRKAWIEGYRPGDGASTDEIRAAREAFEKDFADAIRSSKERRSTLVRQLRAGVRDAVNDASWSEQARAIYSEYKRAQSELSAAWRDTRAELDEDLSREDMRAARNRFNRVNADVIARQKRLARQVRNLIWDNRDERLSMRNELPQEFKDLRSDMATLREQVRTRQRRAREEMESLTQEEREAYRRVLLEELKELHDEIKERRRRALEDVRNARSHDGGPME